MMMCMNFVAKMVDNEGRLASHASRNVELTRYNETDKERLYMHTQAYVTELQNGVDCAKAFVSKLVEKRHTIGMLLAARETQAYLLKLYELRRHLSFTECFSVSWIKKHLQSVYGAVSRLRYFLLILLTFIYC